MIDIKIILHGHENNYLWDHFNNVSPSVLKTVKYVFCLIKFETLNLVLT